MIVARVSLRKLFIIFSSAIFFIFVACGGGDSETASATDDKKAPTATSAPVSAPTATPATDLASSDEVHETGVVVKDIQLEPGEYGGKMTITITNVSDAQCMGPMIMFELLREDKSVATNMGIPSDRPLEPGDEQVLNQRYVGIGVAEATVAGISCDNTFDTGSGGDGAIRERPTESPAK